MLELIAQVDPLAAIMGGLWLFAAGMFPVGFMLGSTCSPCCNPCEACTEGQLPETLTVTLDGFADRAPGPDLIYLSLSSCYGNSFAARVTAPGGEPGDDSGPISAVEITDGGSGYAQLGRSAPTLAISGGSGSEATFTPTLAQSQDECDIDFWSLDSVAVSGGLGYVDGESLTIDIAEGDSGSGAAAIIRTKREEPTLTIEGDADLTLTYTETDGLWTIASVSVIDGGTGYSDGQQLTISLGDGDVEVSGAFLQATTGRLEPTVTPYFPFTNGTGATVSATLTKITDFTGKDAWETSALTIDDAGSGYEVNDFILASTNGQSNGFDLIARVSSIDGNGGVTGISIEVSGQYFLSDGTIQSVAVGYGGEYYKDIGEPESVEVTSGGVYYREDPELSPYVADVSVLITQTAPSDGTGAELSVTIDSNTGSPTFGQITAINIDEGGDGYLAWEWRNTKCCGDYYNGMSVVVKRNNGFGPCIYSHRMCGVGNARQARGLVTVEYRGAGLPPVAAVVSEVSEDVGGGTSDICNAAFVATELLADCSDWSGVELVAGDITATVENGGEYDEMFQYGGPRSCFICCKGAGPLPSEVEMDVVFTGGPGVAGAAAAGVFVLPLDPFVLVNAPANAALWAIPSAGLNTSYVIEMRLCALQSSEGFFPDDGPGECGDTCHRKCRIVVSVGFDFVNVSSGGDGFDCDCLDTPICNPYGEHTLCNRNNFGDCRYTVTIRAPL